MPTLTPGSAIPSIYSHIAQSEDKEDAEIPQPLNQSRGKPEER